MTKSTKKIAMVLFIVFMTAVMAACGNNSATDKEDKAGMVKKD